jgi:hypothetical protein
MIEELLFGSLSRGNRDDLPVVWLIFLSLVRDDLPWLYEPGMELYRALLTGSRSAIEKAGVRMLRVVDMTANSKLIYRVIRGDGEESLFLMRHLDEFVRRALNESNVLFEEVPRPRPTRLRIPIPKPKRE